VCWLIAGENGYVFPNAFETAPMNGTAAEFSDGVFVGFGWIALVFAEIELGIVMVISLHQAVSGNLGDDGCRCN